MTSYIRYEALYGESMPEVAFELPDDLGRWKDIPEIFEVEEGDAVSMTSNLKTDTLFGSVPPER